MLQGHTLVEPSTSSAKGVAREVGEVEKATGLMRPTYHSNPNKLDRMDTHRMKELLLRALENNRSLILDMYEPQVRQPGGFHPPEMWKAWTGACEIIVGRCQPTLSDSVLEDFEVLILDEVVLALARLYQRDVLVIDDEADIRKAYCHARCGDSLFCGSMAGWGWEIRESSPPAVCVGYRMNIRICFDSIQGLSLQVLFECVLIQVPHTWF